MDVPVLAVITVLLTSRVASVALHELSHYSVAKFLGYREVSTQGSCTRVVGIERSAKDQWLVRHAGWIFSVAAGILGSAVALILSSHEAPVSKGVRQLLATAVFSMWWTAADAVTSDLLQHNSGAGDEFLCE